MKKHISMRCVALYSIFSVCLVVALLFTCGYAGNWAAKAAVSEYRLLYRPTENDGIATAPFTVWDETGTSATGIEEGYFSVPTQNSATGSLELQPFPAIQFNVNAYATIPYSADKNTTKYALYFWYYNADNTTRGLKVKLKVSDSAYLEWNLEPAYVNEQMGKNTQGSEGSTITPNAWFLVQLPLAYVGDDNAKVTQYGTVTAGSSYLPFTSIEVQEQDQTSEIVGTSNTKYFYHFYIDEMESTAASVLVKKPIVHSKTDFGIIGSKVESGSNIYKDDVYQLPALQPLHGETPAISYAWYGDEMVSTQDVENWQVRVTYANQGETVDYTEKFKTLTDGVKIHLPVTGNYEISYEYVVNGDEKIQMGRLFIKGVTEYYPIMLGTTTKNLTVGKTYKFTYSLVELPDSMLDVKVESSNTDVLQVVEVDSATHTITYKAVGKGKANLIITPIKNLGASDEKIYAPIEISISVQTNNPIQSERQTYIVIGVCLGIAVLGIIGYGVYVLIKRSKLEVK